MVRPKSVGPSERLLRWTQYIFLVAAGIISLYLFLSGDFSPRAGEA